MSTGATPSTLGSGWAFPLRLDARGVAPAFTSEEDRVKESIDDILNTDIAERPHRVKNGVPYGTRIRRLLFENTDAVVDIARYDAKMALDTWEPRIIVDDVLANLRSESVGDATVLVVQLTVKFRYRATNAPDSYIHPYYLVPPTENV